MWCHRCRQDVPAIALPAMKGVGCIRCGAKLTAVGIAVVAADPSPQSFVESIDFSETPSVRPRSTESPAPQLDFDDWDADAEWRLLDDLLPKPRLATQRASASSAAPPPIASGNWNVLHTAHGPVKTSPQAGQPAGSSWLSWIAIGVGVVILAVAAASPALRIAGWERMESLTWPLIAAGQVCLIVGVTLLVDRIRQMNSATADELQEVKNQLLRLEQSTSPLSGPHSQLGTVLSDALEPSEQSGAVLADVRGQLEILSRRLAQMTR